MPRSTRRMPQDRLGHVGRVARDLGQQFVATAGVAGPRVRVLQVMSMTARAEQEVLAVLRGDEGLDRGGPAATGRERGQGLGGNLVPGERQVRCVHQLAQREGNERRGTGIPPDRNSGRALRKSRRSNAWTLSVDGQTRAAPSLTGSPPAATQVISIGDLRLN